MKGKKYKAEGGEIFKDEAPKEVYAGKGSKVEEEADEKKHGGRAKRRRGGHVMKHVGKVGGEKAMERMDRKPRKAGGRTGSDKNPFSSAKSGTDATAHKAVEIG